MNLYTFNSKLKNLSLRRSFRSLVITLSLLGTYHILVVSKLVTPSNGLHQWQTNFITIQRYAYHKSAKLNLVLVGSSLTANIDASYIDSQVVNLGMRGGCTQTGIEAVRRNPAKPALLLVEINGTIVQKIDEQTINSIYNPWLYHTRLYFPMLRKEYQPVNVFLPRFVSLKQRLIHKLIDRDRLTNNQNNSKQIDEVNSKIGEKLIAQFVETKQVPLPEKQENLLIQEAEYIKSKILQLKQEGIRVILFDIPMDQRLENTVLEKQIKVLMKELFPINKFEWLPEPPPRHWKTYDGIHIVTSDAKDYAAFIRTQLLKP